MKRIILAALSCFLMALGFAGVAAATDPVEPTSTSEGNNPTNNGWTNK